MKTIFAFALAMLGSSFVLNVAAAQSEPAQSTASNSEPSYTTEYDSHIFVRDDNTATETFTWRISVLSRSAIQSISQQQLTFLGGSETLETVEAFTEKRSGKRIPVEPAKMLTRDAATGLQAIYVPDLKQRTIIFPDVEVGDTLVMTHKKEVQSGVWPGHFIYHGVFARSRAYKSIRVVVESTPASSLRVAARGDGVSHVVQTDGAIRRHEINFPQQLYQAEEAGAVAPVDRDAAVLISSLPSYEELGSLYARDALPKAAVTEEIVALANEITQGIEGRRDHARAIDVWIKKNIRYVAVVLSLSRAIPNPADAVWRNKFGDCKDKATLMAALLAVKGIASEPVLISAGNAYSLPEIPISFNHAIIYLPEFDLYDDPTASSSAFGVLSAGSYDKPVLHATATGARLARTPAMKPEDHVGETKTVMNVAADGKITGRTEERATGMLGSALRASRTLAQNLGNESAAVRQLQSFTTPGTGRFEFADADESTDPVVVNSVFELRDPLKPPEAGARAAIPVGLRLLARPGNVLLGPRVHGRKSAFSCYAGRQVEDIEVTFAEGLPLPRPIVARDIDSAAFTYHSAFTVVGRTLRIHREFVSRVQQQVCPAEWEVELATPLGDVRRNISTLFAFADAAPRQAGTKGGAAQLDLQRTVAAGQTLQLSFVAWLNPDCSAAGPATVRLIEEPKHGKVTIAEDKGFASFPQGNARSECSKTKSDGVRISYQPEPGFAGKDSATIESISPSGILSRRNYTIDVR
jgi:hypothetical protein